MLVVGDAAGLVNPFNGEGIGYAMETGELAAEQVPWITMGDMFALGGLRTHVRGLQPIYTHPFWNVWIDK